jgi:hypothetical protein
VCSFCRRMVRLSPIVCPKPENRKTRKLPLTNRLLWTTARIELKHFTGLTPLLMAHFRLRNDSRR